MTEVQYYGWVKGVEVALLSPAGRVDVYLRESKTSQREPRKTVCLSQKMYFRCMYSAEAGDVL